MNKNSKIRNQQNRLALKKAGVKNGVISKNEKTNTQMVVLHNQGDTGGTASLTVHDAIDKNKPIIFKNHKYCDYKQPFAKR